MATNTNSRTSRDQGLSNGEQPSYSGHGSKPWDDTKGLPGVGTTDNSRDDYDSAYSDRGADNGQDYNSDRGRAEQSSDDRSRDSLTSLRDAESSALSHREPSYQDDQNPQSLYTGNGRNSNTSGKAKGKKHRGLAAIITIAITLIAGAAFLGSSNSLLIGALENLITDNTDVQNTGTLTRFLSMTTGMTNGNGYNMPDTFVQNLAKNDIIVQSGGVSFKDQFISSDNLYDFYTSNVDFRESYNTAKRGRAIGFYDKVADRIYTKFGISRNIFSKFRQTGNSTEDAEVFNNTMSAVFEGNTSTTVSSEHPEEKTRTVYNEDGTPAKDTNGNIITETYEEPEINRSERAATTGTDVEAARTKANSFVDSLTATAQKAGQLLSVGCATYRVGNLIAMTVAANAIIQSIHTFQTALEPASKTMAGLGSESGIHELLIKLSNRVTTTVTNADGNSEDITGSPLESTGMQLVLGGIQGAVGAGTIAYIAKTYSSERALTSLLGKSELFNACSGVDITNSVISLAVNLSGGLATIFGGFVIKTLVNGATSLIISAALSFMIPTVMSIFLNNYKTVIGIPWGNEIIQGATNSNGNVAAGGGSSPATEQQVIQFGQATNTILALEAEVDRKNHSPFDISNRNTFFGSIAYSLLPSLVSANASSLASFIRTTSRSVSSIMGGVSAEGEGSTYLTTFGNCPSLESIGATGDIFCGTIRTDDLSVINLQPSDPTYRNAIDPNLDCSSSPCTIRPDSNLGRYITYCDGRTSPFGVADAGILSALQPTNGTIGTLLGYIPIVNDVMSIANAVIDAENMSWATGEKCVNTNDASHPNYTFWQNEAKYYQLYVKDQRILGDMGSTETNPVTAYEDAYEREHPTDYSLAGTIARYTGMAKTDAELLIAFIDYYDFVNQYDPTTHVADRHEAHKSMTNAELAAEIKSTNLYIEHDEYVDNPLETNATHREYIAYFDLRNRSFVV